MVCLIWNCNTQRRLIILSARFINFSTKSNCRVRGRTQSEKTSCHRAYKGSQADLRACEDKSGSWTCFLMWHVSYSNKNICSFMIGNFYSGLIQEILWAFFCWKWKTQNLSHEDPSKSVGPLKCRVQSCLFLDGLHLKSPGCMSLLFSPATLCLDIVTYGDGQLFVSLT